MTLAVDYRAAGRHTPLSPTDRRVEAYTVRKRRRCLDPRSFHMGLILNKVSLGQVFLQAVRIYRVIVIPPMLLTPFSFI